MVGQLKWHNQSLYALRSQGERDLMVNKFCWIWGSVLKSSRSGFRFILRVTTRAFAMCVKRTRVFTWTMALDNCSVDLSQGFRAHLEYRKKFWYESGLSSRGSGYEAVLYARALSPTNPETLDLSLDLEFPLGTGQDKMATICQLFTVFWMFSQDIWSLRQLCASKTAHLFYSTHS